MTLSLEQQVPSRELCEKLKDLGYPQEGIWCWKTSLPKAKVWRFTGVEPEDELVAPTVAEMGELLPQKIKSHGKTYYLTIGKTFSAPDGGTYPFYISYKDVDGWKDNVAILRKRREADSRAEMLIHLLSEGLI